MFFFSLIALLAVAAFLPGWQERKRRPIDGDFRKEAPGSFADLSQGTTHYQWHGPTRGPVLVAIHGLTTPSIVWSNIAPAFGSLGFRVLTYDLYGRGYSDSVQGAQSRAFFTRQLDDLLTHQGIEGDVSLLGYSMGGSIATVFAASNLHRATQVFLIATAGIETNESKFSQFCRRWPLVGDWVHDVFAAKRMKRAIIADTTVSQIDGLHEAQDRELDRRGFLQSVLSSRRGLLNDTLRTAHQAIAKKNIPVFAVWGRDDPVIPISALGSLASWNRGARQDVIEGADHGVTYTHGDQVVELFKKMMTESR